MIDEYYKYINLFLLTRADYYYLNRHYGEAVKLYRKALLKASRYAGNRKAILIASENIVRRLNKAEEKHVSIYPYTNNRTSYCFDLTWVTICGIAAALIGKRYFVY